jgi:hypothetical protein
MMISITYYALLVMAETYMLHALKVMELDMKCLAWMSARSAHLNGLMV